MSKTKLLPIAVLSLLLISFSKTSFAAKSSDFTTHSFEVQVTPSADYLIWRSGNTLVNEPYKTRYPFAGFGFGLNYIFRPLKFIGVSAGLNVKMQGSFERVQTYPPFSPSYISFRGNAHTGYISIPVQAHLYKQMSNCTFEFAVGPEFNIPIFTRSAGTSYNSGGEKLASSHDSGKLTMSQMHDGASFGLSILLGGEMRVCNHANLFVGPQIQFLDLVRFDKDIATAEKTSGRFYDVSLGIKFGFRFH